MLFVSPTPLFVFADPQFDSGSHFTLRMARLAESVDVPVAVLRRKPLLRDTRIASFVFQSLPLAGQTGASYQQIVQPVR